MQPATNASLVKYDNPVLVSGAKGKGKSKAGPSGGKALPPVDGKQLTQTEDILNSILPPRYAAALGFSAVLRALTSAMCTVLCLIPQCAVCWHICF